MDFSEKSAGFSVFLGWRKIGCRLLMSQLRQRVDNHGGGLLEDSDESSSVTNSGYGWKNGLVLFGGFMRGFDCSE